MFSQIYNNHIYNIAVKHEYFGYEIAGIKLHAAIDVQIHDNNIHDCTLGTCLTGRHRARASAKTCTITTTVT